jgi:uncharacterized damage-inducible protein DinB
MEMSRQIVRELKLNYGVIQAQLDGLTDEETRIQPPYRANCLNWILGHLVSNRGGMVTLLEMEPLWDEDDYACYARESEPITTAEAGLPLERLIADLASAQEHLLARIKRMDASELEVTPAGHERSLGEQLSFLSWHETYHVGQTEALRQLAGKNDKVI